MAPFGPKRKSIGLVWFQRAVDLVDDVHAAELLLGHYVRWSLEPGELSSLVLHDTLLPDFSELKVLLVGGWRLFIYFPTFLDDPELFKFKHYHELFCLLLANQILQLQLLVDFRPFLGSYHILFVAGIFALGLLFLCIENWLSSSSDSESSCLISSISFCRFCCL